MWFDSHCHLNAPEFKGDLDDLVKRCISHALDGVLIPTVQVADFELAIEIVKKYAQQLPKICYSLGIHPLYTAAAQESDIAILEQKIEQSLHDQRFIGLGEIGLDYFVEGLDLARQEWFFEEQLKLARKFNLPVILHIRRSQDATLKRLRQIKVSGGIAHAFNGSFQQAEQFLKLNFKLGLGGVLTYPRALQVRRLAAQLPLSAFVLETDAPDIPPAWLSNLGNRRNEPSYLVGIGKELAQIRNISELDLAQSMDQNVCAVLPRWQSLCNSLKI